MYQSDHTRPVSSDATPMNLIASDTAMDSPSCPSRQSSPASDATTQQSEAYLWTKGKFQLDSWLSFCFRSGFEGDFGFQSALCSQAGERTVEHASLLEVLLVGEREMYLLFCPVGHEDVFSVVEVHSGELETTEMCDSLHRWRTESLWREMRTLELLN